MIRSLVRPAACALAAAAVTAVLLAVPASTPSQAATFTLSDPNCSSFNWDSASSTLTCVTSGGGGGALSCTIAASPSNSTTVGTNVTLTANCSGGTSPYNYTWSGGGSGGCPSSGGATNQQALTSPAGAVANCAYSVAVTDSAASPAQTNANKNVSWSTGGGGGGGGNIDCKSLNGSVSGTTHVITIPWALATKVFTADNGGFGPDDAVIVKFTTSNITTSTSKGNISAVEFSDPPSGRDGSLSDQPCDFSTGLPLAGGGRTVFANNNGPFIWFSVVAKKTGAAQLNAGQTYYFNLRNSSGSTCRSTGSCNMDAVINKPSGT